MIIITKTFCLFSLFSYFLRWIFLADALFGTPSEQFPIFSELENWVGGKNGFWVSIQARFRLRMNVRYHMDGGVVNSGSLPPNAISGCRFRLRSAFDSFSIASEAFSEVNCSSIPIGIDQPRFWPILILSNSKFNPKRDYYFFLGTPGCIMELNWGCLQTMDLELRNLLWARTTL